MVEPGQGVKAGELVGRPLKEGVPVHCGVSGTVSAVENRPTLEGEGLCVVVENDYAGVAASGLKREEGREGLIRLMREPGWWEWAARVSHLSEIRLGQALEQVLINGCECEPYLTCDHALMLYWPERVVAGAKAMGKRRAAPRWSSVWRTSLGRHRPAGGDGGQQRGAGAGPAFRSSPGRRAAVDPERAGAGGPGGRLARKLWVWYQCGHGDISRPNLPGRPPSHPSDRHRHRQGGASGQSGGSSGYAAVRAVGIQR